MILIHVIELWDPKGKQWLPVAIEGQSYGNWYDEEAGKCELVDAKEASPGQRMRLMRYIPITQAANEVKRQCEAREKLRQVPTSVETQGVNDV